MSVTTIARATSRRTAFHGGQDHGSNQASGMAGRLDGDILARQAKYRDDQALLIELGVNVRSFLDAIIADDEVSLSCDLRLAQVDVQAFFALLDYESGADEYDQDVELHSEPYDGLDDLLDDLRSDLPSHVNDGRDYGFGRHSARDTGQCFDAYEGVYDEDRATWSGALYGA